MQISEILDEKEYPTAPKVHITDVLFIDLIFSKYQ